MTQRLTIATILLFAFVFCTSSAQSPLGLRGIINFSRQLTTVADPIPCDEGTSGTGCVCPGKCLTYYNSTGGCHPNDCWKWSNMKSTCEEDGRPFIPAIVLQAIPVTGVFGSGWGNIGRWDIFGYYMAVVFGGLGLMCLLACCLGVGSSEGDSQSAGLCCGYCFALLWGLSLIALYVWGIFAIASKPEAPWTDWQGNAINCALVD